MSDMPSVFRQITRTARKEHKCCECRQPIKVGEKYIYSSGIWDGRAGDYRQCLICNEVSNAAASLMDDPEDMPTLTGLREWFACQVGMDFKGEEFISAFSKDMNVEPHKIRHVLGPRFFC